VTEGRVVLRSRCVGLSRRFLLRRLSAIRLRAARLTMLMSLATASIPRAPSAAGLSLALSWALSLALSWALTVSLALSLLRVGLTLVLLRALWPSGIRIDGWALFPVAIAFTAGTALTAVAPTGRVAISVAALAVAAALAIATTVAVAALTITPMLAAVSNVFHCPISTIVHKTELPKGVHCCMPGVFFFSLVGACTA
jgi:hypothetical protein